MASQLQADVDSEPLSRDGQKIILRPKSLAVLRYLRRHAERVIGKEELLAACWPDVQVSPHALKVCIREIRAALGDRASAPQFIETIPHQGYRFIAPLKAAQPPVSGSGFLVAEENNAQRETSNQKRETLLVGRETELAQLYAWLEKALSGQPQVAFVTGEAGIGKTTLVDMFLMQIAEDQHWTVARGQCLEHYGAGEAYMPVLQAVEQLCRSSERQRFIPLLRQHAPTWLVQLPSLLSPAEREALGQELFGASRDRMLREAATIVDALTAKRGLVLVLEDLHWSDPSTAELLSFLARHRGAGRLMLLGTYRSGEISFPEHPLQVATLELYSHSHCRELKLQRLTEPAVRTYVTWRFVGAELPESFVRFVHQRTEGNPLFMVNIVGHMVEQELLVQQEGHWEWKADQGPHGIELPANIQRLIVSHVARLSLQLQIVLEAASVAGMSFTTATVAAALGREQEEVEQHCEQLARQGRFLQAKDLAVWPDGTAATQYEFLHALYQETLYERIAPGRRILLHRRIGERLEAGYREQANAISAELAMHCERGRDYQRAVTYHQQAGENALRRYAYQGVIDHCSQGIALLKHVPETPERDQREFQLLILLGTAFYMIKGPMASESEAIYDRACELSARLAVAPQLAPAYLGLVRYYATRGKLQKAGEVVDKLFVLTRHFPDASFLSAVYAAQGGVRFFLGDFPATHNAAEHALENYDAQKHGSLIFRLGEEPGILGLAMQALTLWYLGYSDQAIQKCQEASSLSQVLPHPFNIAFAQVYAGFLHHLRGEVQEAQQQTEALFALATKQEVSFWLAPGLLMRGWVLTKQGEWTEGINLMRQGLEQLQAFGAEVWWVVYQAMLSEVYQKAGHLDEGRQCLDEALTRAQAVGEFFYSAELYRLKGELLLAQQSKQER